MLFQSAWHGRYAAKTSPEAVYGDRLSTDQRGTSSKPDTFDHPIVSRLVKETTMSSEYEESARGTREGLDTRWSSSYGKCGVTSTRPHGYCQESKEHECRSRCNAFQRKREAGSRTYRCWVHPIWGPHPPIRNAPLDIATIAQAINHARRGGLYPLETVKLQELGNTGKNRDHMMTRASKAYHSNRDFPFGRLLLFQGSFTTAPFGAP